MVGADTGADNGLLANNPQFTPTSLIGGDAPPRNNALNRLRPGPKDTIPIQGKPPRKQRSSRFVVTEKVDIERLPPFMGPFIFSNYIFPNDLHFS